MKRRQIVEILRRSRRHERESLCLKVQWAPGTLDSRKARVDFVRWLEPLLRWTESEVVPVFRDMREIVSVRTSSQASVSCDPSTGVVMVRVSAQAGRDSAGLARALSLLTRRPGEAIDVQVLGEEPREETGC